MKPLALTAWMCVLTLMLSQACHGGSAKCPDLKSDPDNPAGFLQNVHGRWVARPCAPGTEWEEGTCGCGWPAGQPNDGSQVVHDIMEGSHLCLQWFMDTTGQDFFNISMLTDNKPPCHILEALLVCEMENVETVLGSDIPPDMAASMQKTMNEQMQTAGMPDCLLNVADVIRRMRDGTAPTLG